MHYIYSKLYTIFYAILEWQRVHPWNEIFAQTELFYYCDIDDAMLCGLIVVIHLQVDFVKFKWWFKPINAITLLLKVFFHQPIWSQNLIWLQSMSRQCAFQLLFHYFNHNNSNQIIESLRNGKHEIEIHSRYSISMICRYIIGTFQFWYEILITIVNSVEFVKKIKMMEFCLP